MIKEVIPAGEAQVALQRQIGELLNELKDIFQGIYLIKDLSQKTSDTIVSYGERLSSIIVAQLTGAEWFDSRKFIKTEKKHSKHVLDTELTNSLVRETFSSLPKRVLVPGFISTDKMTGEVTNLGRGGSDYTAAIIAAALDADSLEIWTDVDGFMTADPRVISRAYTINELSYVEATELCNFGAKVVYPPTIYPVCHKNIPILVKNTFNPEGVGTVIKREVSDPQSKAIKGISSINDTSLITVQGLGMVGVIGVNYRKDNHKLYIHASEWIGTPYRAGGDSKRGTDCSGLVSQLYKKVYHTRLSRSTDGQLKESSKISRRNLREGDLVFFTSRASRKKVAHVGIYLKDGKFIHASTSQGVIVSNLREKYYTQHWLCGGRIK